MAQSFSASSLTSASHSGPARLRVLVTGAAGNIGSYFARHACDKYDLRLLVHNCDDKAKVNAVRPFGQVICGDIDNLERMKVFCGGAHTVLHLAGDPSPSATWESLLPSNIVGTYNTLVAAKAAGCQRVVYASSIHAISGYEPDVQVKTTDPVNPGDLYGVSKCFGEALCRYMAEKEGLSAIAVRIGAFQPLEAAEKREGLAMLDGFVSERDLQQLLERCIDAEETLKFALVHGLSGNRFNRMDISDTRELLGYRPQDDATKLNVATKNLKLSETVNTHSLSDKKEQSGLRDDLKSNPDATQDEPQRPVPTGF